ADGTYLFCGRMRMHHNKHGFSVKSCGTDEFSGIERAAENQAVDGFEQIVQPGGTGSFFEGSMQTAAPAVDKLERSFRLSFREWLPSPTSRRNPKWRPRRSLLGLHPAQYHVAFL